MINLEKPTHIKGVLIMRINNKLLIYTCAFLFQFTSVASYADSIHSALNLNLSSGSQTGEKNSNIVGQPLWTIQDYVENNRILYEIKKGSVHKTASKVEAEVLTGWRKALGDPARL